MMCAKKRSLVNKGGPAERYAAGILVINMLVVVALAGYFFLAPGFLVIRNLRDPAIQTGEIPREAWRLHRYLTPRYATWARTRIASGAAARVHYLNVPGTEWPLFGSVFFLWATEHLQVAWEKDHRLSPRAPAVYARDTIEACKELLLDPKHHTWVETHWGADYMHTENVFFRSLLIAGLTSYEKLTGTGEVVPLLRDQVDTLAKELDASRYGVLYDYPQECYPIDVFAAVAWLRRADEVLGTDHSAFVAHERRAFTGHSLDEHGLVPWLVNPVTGVQYESSRGIVNSHVLIFAHEIYPELAKEWYEIYTREFWQDRWYGEGFREFHAKGERADQIYDVDAGLIVGGFSPAANAFGLAAAKINGRLDHAYTLTAQVLTACWPLPDGRLLGPRLLSDPFNAPYLGETGILWQLTETPPEGIQRITGGRLTGAVTIGLVFYFGVALLCFSAAGLRIRRWLRVADRTEIRAARLQWSIWGLMMVSAIGAFVSGSVPVGMLALASAQFFPRTHVRAKQEEA